MIINHNMNAMNAHRNMSMNTVSAGKSMEKLSSGLRINRAGDDAAGLAISEKMRGQIRGLDQASRNSQDAISMIQTAEGGLNETHSILQRMRELSVQSANDTNVKVDRGAIQDEMNQLTSEIDRIANNTEFNTQKLLDGSFSGKFQIGANNGQNMDLSVGKMDSSSLGLVTTNTMETIALAGGSNLKDGVYTVKGTNLLDVKGNTVGTTNGAKITVNTVDTTFVTAKAGEGATLTIKDGSISLDNTITGKALKLAPGNYEVKGTNVVKDGKLVGTLTDGVKITLDDIGDVTAAELGFIDAKLTDKAKFTINGADVSTRDKADGTITSVNNAIETVSKERSKLGAVQNRLEHTIANLNTSAENLQASESRVRDVDMAKEMMAFSKNNILAQAAQAMLAQANSQPQGVLQLLR
ncbi:flagellin [Clostridium algidicarnis]|uniref:flagellin N-terminal helical domain-containing protein n=1 Tax=Clostridium algidicarnis TaxID=37659 RepID=UPI001C0D24D2|nr:flagellin [Clostridium algidicarnis]MBU3202953.1 flagellin [Clostridium algidicarnis]MBU3211107.1 flagellin [Clostridium algidicarnis]MBU3222385.1 flagellin [Clostridium algidicarnis]